MERNNLRKQEPLTTQLLAEEANDDNRVDSAVTPLLLFSIFIAVSGSFAYGSAIGYSSPVESAIMEELGLTTAQFSLFGSMLTVGSLLGSLSSGKITDSIGRRGAMGLSDVIGLLGWITISVSQEKWSLYVGRFFVGASTGILAYVVIVHTEKSNRVMISTGVLVMFFVGSLIPWRILVLIGIVPSLVQLLGLFLIPESPRFLAKRGQNDAYMTVLQRLRGDNVDITKEAANIHEFTESIRNIAEVNFFGLFKRKYAHPLVAAVGLMALSGFGGPVAVLYYASSIFESAGFSSSIASVVLAVVQLPTAIMSAYLIDKLGRRPLLMISAGAMSFCCFLVGSMFLFKENNLLENRNPYFIVVGLWGYSAAFPIGMAGIPYVIMSEVFSMDVKGSAGSLSAVVLSWSGWVLSYTFNFVTGWSFPGAFFILASINAFATFFVVKLVPETNGKTLEEIQESLY
ncbi:hypothetical protein V2J09_001069 [Rumex salicifolius]